ncbi:uncharacterized protein LOC110241002 [Exaiptasia diaphana]|uniref:Apple domain-containing protein n=1 Tax=Exaiptasia diaphana TaxID=2652724 RepID=A0A913XCU7_EXADI|nr:uncharacterized protein LOC110241002 [Exaiptasia diaphana]
MWYKKSILCFVVMALKFEGTKSQTCKGGSFIPEGACKMSVFVRSEGEMDPNRSVSLGSSYLIVGGKEYSKKSAGIIFFIFEQKTGKHVSSEVFDVKSSSANGDKLRDFIAALPNDVIIVMAVQTSGNANNNLAGANSVFFCVGLNDTAIGDQESFAAILCKGSREFCRVKKSKNSGGQGPSYISILLPLKIPFNTLNGPCAKGTSYQRVYSDAIENHAIVGPLLVSKTANNIEDCKEACFFYKGDSCFMFNYNQASKKCELFHEGRVSEYKVIQIFLCTFKTRKVHAVG